MREATCRHHATLRSNGFGVLEPVPVKCQEMDVLSGSAQAGGCVQVRGSQVMVLFIHLFVYSLDTR